MHDDLCPEMNANEMHELYDRHPKVSPTLNSFFFFFFNLQNTKTAYITYNTDLLHH